MKKVIFSIALLFVCGLGFAVIADSFGDPTQKSATKSTKAAAETVFFEDFENAPGTAGSLPLPTNWVRTASPENAQDYWRAGYGTFNTYYPIEGALGSSKYMLTGGFENTRDLWAYTPAIALTQGTAYDVSFYVQLRPMIYEQLPNTVNDFQRYEALAVYFGTAQTPAGIKAGTTIFNRNDTAIGGRGTSTKEWMLVTKRFVAPTTGDYYLGFNCYSPPALNATLIDNVKVVKCATGAAFDGDKAPNLGNLYTNLGQTHETLYPVRNSGTENLTLTLGTASAGLTVDGLASPMTILPGETKHLTMKLPLAVNGDYNGTFSLTTNDPANTTVNVNVKAKGVEARLTNYMVEDFENTRTSLPVGWEDAGHGGWLAQLQCGKDQTRGIEVEMYNHSEMGKFWPILITHYVNMGANPKVAFDYRIVQTGVSAGQGATQAQHVHMDILISKDFGKTYDTIYEMKPDGTYQHTPNLEYQRKSINIPSDYANQICRIMILNHYVDGAHYNVSLDNVAIGTRPTKDLAIIDRVGITMPHVDLPAEYQFTIQNKGTETQNSYKVELINRATGAVLSDSTFAYELKQDSSKVVSVWWTPKRSELVGKGKMNVYGRVTLEGDQEPTNDTYLDLSVCLLDTMINIIPVGGGGTTHSRSPFMFGNPTSASQTIYLKEELETNGGKITGLSYMVLSDPYADDANDIQIEVRIGETSYGDLQRAWIDPSTLTKVFDGTVSVQSGYGVEMIIPFDTPYAYKGRNLVVYVFKNSRSYNNAGQFLCTATPSQRTRTSEASDWQYPESGEQQGLYLVAPYMRVLQDVTGLGKMTGLTKDADADTTIAGALVDAYETSASKLSDEGGRYTFYMTPGEYKFEASAFGFSPDSTVQTLVADTEVVHDFRLKSISRHQISGTITDILTGAKLADAIIMFQGYTNFAMRADTGGNYNSNALYSGKGIYKATYLVRVVAAGYVDYYGEVTVDDTTTTFDFQMEEYPFMVNTLKADTNLGQTEAYITWTPPKAHIEFRYDKGAPFEGSYGYNTAALYGVMGAAHRTPAILYSMSWYLTDQVNKSPTKVNLFVFALDADGNPTNRILAWTRDWPSTKLEWNTFKFTQPVICQYGFLLAISSASADYLAIGATNPSDEYPFKAQTNYMNPDFSMQTFIPVENNQPSIQRNFMIRATGTPYEHVEDGYAPELDETPELTAFTGFPENEEQVLSESDNGVAKQPVKSNKAMLGKYTLYRLVEGSAPSTWTKLLDKSTDLTYTDKAYGSLEDLRWQYAVVTDYTNYQSMAKLSNAVPKGAADVVDIQQDTENVQVYFLRNTVYVINRDEVRLKTVQVIDLQGRTVLETNGVGSFTFDVNAPNGMYIVRIVQENGTVGTTKVVISR